MAAPGEAPPAVSTAPTGDAREDVRTQRCRMWAVWAAAGSALAAMVAWRWRLLALNGGHPKGGDMVGHSAAAEWLRTLPWWDWRGWSDWFYGGQAIGVNYPPLGHAWLRFTHPGHGQMAAVALGMLVLLPWGSWRLARGVGFAPRAQRAAVGAVLTVVALSAHMHWLLPGFHESRTAFGGWPAMLAVVLGLFCAAWAARGRRPVACGAVAGVAILLNVTVMPGVAIACVTLLASSGTSLRRAVHWAASAVAVTLAVCAWWLVPFVAGWGRLVRWDVTLATTWAAAGTWGVVVVAAVAAGAVRAVRGRSAPAWRLVTAAAAVLLATLVGNGFGYLRAERWLAVGLLLAAAAAGGLLDLRPSTSRPRPQRFVPGPLARAGVVVLVVLVVLVVAVARRYEALPLAAWLLWKPGRTWVIVGALAWAGVLLLVPLRALFGHLPPPAPAREAPLAAVVAAARSDASGFVYLDGSYATPAGDTATCDWVDAWRTTAATAGRIRPLAGLYRETSTAAEFLDAERNLRTGSYIGSERVRPHWFDPWGSVGGRTLETPAAAAALGARWFVECRPEGDLSVLELTPVVASGVTVARHASEEAWHRDAVEWWVIKASGSPDGGVSTVPILTPGGTSTHPSQQAASGVSLEASGEGITVRAERAGWAWLRVPWDPGWRSTEETPVHLGGPGHLVVWVDGGVTELRWGVAREVDIAAVATTVAAALAAGILVLLDRRRDKRGRAPAPQSVPHGGAGAGP